MKPKKQSAWFYWCRCNTSTVTLLTAFLRTRLTLLLMTLLVVTSVNAQRPTEGGVYAYGEEEQIAFFDVSSGMFRVHYSIRGPQETRLEDFNNNGVPDFVERVGETMEKSWSNFHLIGFRRPIVDRRQLDRNVSYRIDWPALVNFSEEDFWGGSEAIDVYLIDFQGGADGIFSIDDCREWPLHCSGWIGLENDFLESAYPSWSEAIDIVAPHELFHAVQAAYHGAQPTWFSEGTAVWAQTKIIDESEDFLRKCDAYLELAHRPLYAVPSGPVQGFSYGTALFWWFLHDRHFGEIDVDLQHVTEFLGDSKTELVHRIDRVLEDADDSFAEAWFAFIQKNLATGFRSEGMDASFERYPFAAKLHGIQALASGPAIQTEMRLTPLAANYYHLQHLGGSLAAGLHVSASGVPVKDVRFALFAVDHAQYDGPVAGPIAEWDGLMTGAIDLGTHGPGGYWVVASNVNLDDEWVEGLWCAGPSSFVASCLNDLDSAESDGIETARPSDESNSNSTDDGKNDGSHDVSPKSQETPNGNGDSSKKIEGMHAGCSCGVRVKGQSKVGLLYLFVSCAVLVRIRRWTRSGSCKLSSSPLR